MKKWRATLNEKTKKGNGLQAFLHLKSLQNDFVLFEGCCNLNEASAIEKSQRIARDT